MRVELLTHGRHTTRTGIGRYVHALLKYGDELADVNLRRLKYLPFYRSARSLEQVPVGISGHVRGSIVHFPQITGCAMMLYRPYHPSVATVHDLGFLELPEEWEMFDPVARQILRLSLAGLKRVDLIVAVSEFTRRGVIKHIGVPPERVVTVHSGIDHDLFRPIPNARDVLSQRYPRLASVSSAPWVLYVGSELPRKNIGALLEAVSIMRADTPDIQLVKVGAAGGEQFRRQTLRTIDALGLQNQVHIFDDVAEEELPLFYSAADVFVTASKLEGFGFPVLEAMACATPVIAPDIGVFNEITLGSSFLVRSGEVGELSMAIRTILTDVRVQAELREKGLKIVSMYTWPKAVERHIDVYCQLTAESSVANSSRPKDSEKYVDSWSRSNR